MIAMQYTVRLPNEYPVERLRQRVAERAPLFDSLAGLAHKSFLLDAEQRTYAPFYVWRSHDAMREFLFSDLFGSVIAAFGRPRIRHWSVLAYDHGGAAVRPTFACYEIDRVEQDENVVEVRRRERASHEARLATQGLFSHIVALDPDRWEICRFSLWADRSARGRIEADCTLGFEVLHVSEPAP